MSEMDPAFEDLLSCAVDRRLDPSVFNAYLLNSSTNADALCSKIAIAIAERFLNGTLSYEDADVAANELWRLSLTGNIYQPPELVGLSDPAMSIYQAFDAGEWRRPTDPSDVDPVERYTKPFLNQVLRDLAQSRNG